MKSQSASKSKITIYFDGLCHLCSREISHYQRMTGSKNIRFVDITGVDFDAEAEGIDGVQAHKTMHVKNRQGEILKGVDAFICIWNEIPSLRFLVPAARLAPIYWTLNVLYAGFAQIRPFLPRKSCEQSPYCDLKPKR